jgi:hypothetical protein
VQTSIVPVTSTPGVEKENKHFWAQESPGGKPTHVLPCCLASRGIEVTVGDVTWLKTTDTLDLPTGA